MFLFMDDIKPCWWRYLEALGIQGVLDDLKKKGLPGTWPIQLPDINEKYVFWHPKGKPFSCYQSQCPHYEGYYLGGVRSAVKCTACPELLPGIVVDTMCRERFKECPYYREENDV